MEITVGHENTFHSLATLLWSTVVDRDYGMEQVLKSPIQKHVDFDTLLIDEGQDINALYYDMLMALAATMSHPIQIVIVGQVEQCVYGDHPLPRYCANTEYLSRPEMTKHDTRTLGETTIVNIVPTHSETLHVHQ